MSNSYYNRSNESRSFKDWDNFEIIFAILATIMFFPLSMIFWIVKSIQKDERDN